MATTARKQADLAKLKATKPRRKSSELVPLPPEELEKHAGRELDEHEWLYVKARASGMSHRASLRAAGWSVKSYPAAMRLETRPAIAAALAAERRAYAAASQITRKQVIDGIMEAISQAKLQAEPQAQIAGWKEIAKICGHYAPEVRRIELTDDAQRMMQKFEAMSDEDLLRITTETEVEDVDYEDAEQEAHEDG